MSVCCMRIGAVNIVMSVCCMQMGAVNIVQRLMDKAVGVNLKTGFEGIDLNDPWPKDMNNAYLSGCTALFCAVFSRSEQAVWILLKHGLEKGLRIDIVGLNDTTPLTVSLVSLLSHRGLL